VGRPVSLYFHVPFCKSRCPYCDFYSTTALDRREDYAAALARSVAAAPLGEAYAPTVYFGGGTPYLLGEKLLEVLEAADRRFPLPAGCEITLEANPGDLEGETLRALRRGGFNRLSLGLQAGDSQGLAALGRRHTLEESARGVALARETGFQNLSVDIMLATPGQDVQKAVALADYAAGLGPEHISAYLLKIEPGTPFHRDGVAGRCPDPDQAADIYLAVRRRLMELGYVHYEISNFAKPGFESRHNLVYWRMGEYLGCGPSAASCAGGRRFRLPGDLGRFLAAVDPWSLAIDEGEAGGLLEYVMLSLRLAEGLDTARLAGHGGDAAALLRRAAPLEKAGYLTVTEGRVALTGRGFLLSNSIIGALLGE
jgi:oxygen-independent coproporphyrinogen-3 oxidase